MSKSEIASACEQSIQAVLRWRSKKDSLIRRRSWGDESFSDDEESIDTILKMAHRLSTMPIGLLEETVLQQLGDSLRSLDSIFQEIDGLKTKDMIQEQQNISDSIRRVHETIRDIFRESAWLFLLNSDHWMAGAKEEYDEIQGIKRKAREELAETSSAAKTARELAGSAGAAEFTAGFREAKELAGAGSLVWLWASGISVALALLSAAVLMYLEVSGILKSPTAPIDAIIHIGWRMAIVGGLGWVANWCGGNYRAYRHGYEVNQHRAICLENMTAFQRSADGAAAKDAIVTEFSRAATQGMPTGFIK